MKKILLSAILLTASANAQDIIKMDGTELNVKITGNNAETISFNGVNDLPYYIAKAEINEIDYANGTVEKIPHPELTLEQAKTNIITLVNTYGLTKDGNKLKAQFEDRNLRITELDAKEKPVGDGMLFDIMKLIRFDETAYRREMFAFINIWVPFLKNEKKMQWERYKLVIRVDSHEKAAVMTYAFKQLNKALKANR